MTESPTKQDIDAKIQLATDECKADEQLIVNLREERARLFVKNENDSKIPALDKRLAQICNRAANSPAVIKELENQLAVENQRLANAEREELKEAQLEVAADIESLSLHLLKHLKSANEVNDKLRLAFTAYNGLKEKTGQEVLVSYCQGSQQSLSMLLELMELQLSGTQIAVSGPGIVGSNTRILL